MSSLLPHASPSPPQPSARFSVSSAPLRFASFAVLALITVIVQLAQPGPARELFIFDRAALAAGELWRLWTGHLCHFGGFHALADTAVFLFAAFALARRRHLALTATAAHALLALPAFVSLAIFLLDPAMSRYAGLSGINVGLLVFLALDAWRRHRRDWFWPALLALHALELLFEHFNGGLGGGAIRFDEPAIRIATIAHLAGAAYGIFWFFLSARFPAPRASATQLSLNSSQAI